MASDVIAQPLWDTVVLQEASFEPIPSSLTQNPNSDPPAFCNAVETIEHGVHNAAPNASVYLYATWAPADTAYLDTTVGRTSFPADRFKFSLAELTAAYDNAYVSAAVHDGHIRDIAPVGDAWARAWQEGVANPDPYSGSAPGVALSFDYQPGSEPSTKDVPIDSGFHHPSIYGAYLSGLVHSRRLRARMCAYLGRRKRLPRSWEFRVRPQLNSSELPGNRSLGRIVNPPHKTGDPCTSNS